LGIKYRGPQFILITGFIKSIFLNYFIDYNQILFEKFCCERKFTMKKYLLFFWIAFIIIIFSVNLNAQWKQVNIGPVGGKINSIAVIPIGTGGSTVFAGTESGIIRSTDNGINWASVNSSFTYCLATIGQEIFAGTSSGVILSTDNGNSWTAPSANINYFITALAVDNTTIFAGTYQNGIFRSTDNGASWTAVDNGLGAFQNLVTSLAVSPTGTNRATIYAGTASGLCFSTDNGNSWSTLVSNYLGPLQFINCITVNGSIIFVGTPGGIIRSTGGNSFEKADTGLANGTSIFSILINNSDTFIGTTAGVYLSIDSGGTWTAVNNGLPVSPSQVYSVAAGGTNLYAGTNNGVYLSINNGTSWTNANPGNVVSQLDCIAGNGSNIFAIMRGSPNQLMFVSKDYGKSWIAAADSGLSGFVANLTLTDSGLYAATNNGIFRSSNNGENWNSMNGGIMGTTDPITLITSGLNLIAATQSNGLFLSTDNGESWKITGSSSQRYVYTLYSFGSKVFAGGSNGIYISTDYGKNWTISNDTLTDVGTILSIGSNLCAVREPVYPRTGLDTTQHPGGLFLSIDSGKTWLPHNFFPDTLFIGGPVAVHGSNIFMVAGENGVYFSKYNWQTWNSIGNGLPDEPVAPIFVNDSSIFVGVGISHGIWQRRLSEITGIKEPLSTAFLGSYKLLQNYPNPFNPATTIKYQLSMTNFVTLKVYDILGRYVKTLVNEQQSAGTHSVIFNAGGLSSGVYFYRITCLPDRQAEGSFIQTKKLIVIK
jgi:hypothetical protein